MFVQRVHVYPALGKANEMRAALEELVKKLQAQGTTISLSVNMYGPEGQSFAASTKFRDLAELENRRRQLLGDSGYQAAVAKLNSLNRMPPKWELYEVLVPYPK